MHCKIFALCPQINSFLHFTIYNRTEDIEPAPANLKCGYEVSVN